MRAAASSIARGNRSRRSHIASMTGTRSAVRAKDGSAASARCVNRVRAVVAVKGSDRQDPLT